MPFIHLERNVQVRRRADGAPACSLSVLAGRWIATALVATVLLGALLPTKALAHPADQLLQHTQVNLAADEVRVLITIGGGVLAKERLIADLDTDGDGAASAEEVDAWRRMFAASLSASIDHQAVAIDIQQISATIPDLMTFHNGTDRIQVELRLPAGSQSGVEQVLRLQNDYLKRLSAHTFTATTLGEVGLVSQGWPSAQITLVYGLDVGQPVDEAAEDQRWTSTAIEARAADLFNRDKSASFFVILLASFTLMGALHAAQPGHGKAVVAGYLVASEGSTRDALALAGIVTLTHTSGVFLLGGLTIGLSALLLPSRVVPIMQLISGAMVVVLGLSLLRRGVAGARRHPSEAQPGEGHHPEHHHHHATLSDEEHARLHVEEALAVRNQPTRRGLITLGVAGGIVPCPEALAILLLAIGIHQPWLGMLAVVAFSLGLAAVLIAFGVSITQLKAHGAKPLAHLFGANAGTLGTFGAVARRWLPVASAVMITMIGVALMWTQLA